MITTQTYIVLSAEYFVMITDLTLALKIVNGHSDVPSDYIPWSLVHVGKNTSVYADAI